MLPAPRQKLPEISPIFKADTVTLHVSREKDREIAAATCFRSRKIVGRPAPSAFRKGASSSRCSAARRQRGRSRRFRGGDKINAAMPKRLKIVRVNDKMQRGYRYVLTAPIGRNFDPEFRPELTPKEMLALGVFCGKYMTDCGKEFPASWFAHARLSPSGRDRSLNYFGVDASQPLSVWRDKGWIHPNDPRGWFQWYCRYYMGRRMPQEDARQIKRWKAIRRHVAQIKKHCEPGDQMCRPHGWLSAFENARGIVADLAIN